MEKDTQERKTPFSELPEEEALKTLEAMSREELVELLAQEVKDPFLLDGLSREELETLREETEDRIALLERKLEAIAQRLKKA